MLPKIGKAQNYGLYRAMLAWLYIFHTMLHPLSEMRVRIPLYLPVLSLRFREKCAPVPIQEMAY